MGDNRAEEARWRARNPALWWALFGAAATAAAGGIALMISRQQTGGPRRAPISDAPASSFRGDAREHAPIERTVTINRPAHELYAFWREFTNLQGLMDNVERIEKLDADRSRWTIKGPVGSSFAFVSRVTEDQPGKVIAWESEDGADVRNSGRVEFIDAAPGRGTMVRAEINYDPPFGAVGQAVAKVTQREPNVQVRRDLRRFKQLMETGEITSSASPSGRRSEDPTRQYL